MQTLQNRVLVDVRDLDARLNTRAAQSLEAGGGCGGKDQLGHKVTLVHRRRAPDKTLINDDMVTPQRDVTISRWIRKW